MMDAVELLKEAWRMCKKQSDCKLCPISEFCRIGDYVFKVEEPEKAVEIVEKWASENPKKTRQSEFLKVLPRAKVEDGVLCYYPCDMDVREGFKDANCERFQGDCHVCRIKYWLTEAEWVHESD